MKTYRYNVPTFDGTQGVTITEQEIMERYWNTWYEWVYRETNNDSPRCKRLRDLQLGLQKDECVRDWCSIHTATEIDNE